MNEPYIDLDLMLDILDVAMEAYEDKLSQDFYTLEERVVMQECRDHARDLMYALNRKVGN